jgi:hypothetical protein
LSEQIAVDSITHTLAANVSSISRLKILIHGQEAETLAGHVDLTGFFPVGISSVTPATSNPQSPAQVSPGLLNQRSPAAPPSKP